MMKPAAFKATPKLGVKAERFRAAVSRDKFDYTQWRQTGLPSMSLQDIAHQANQLSAQLNKTEHN